MGDMWYVIIITVHDTSLSVISCNFLSQCSLGDKSKPVKTKKRKAHPIRYHSKLNNIRPETHVNGKEKKKKKKKPGENKEKPQIKSQIQLRSSLTAASAMSIFSSRNQRVLSKTAWNDLFFSIFPVNEDFVRGYPLWGTAPANH